MAVKPDFPQKTDEDNNLSKLGIKVEGDLGKLEIVETSDSECSDDDNNLDDAESGPIQTIPCSLLQSGQAPVVSNVAINNSENVQFGNNTYFHGPVVIKQIINKKGIENAAYTSTDNENDHVSAHQSPDNLLKTRFNGASGNNIFSPWIKVILSIASVLILGFLCALAFYIQSHRQDDSSPDFDPNTPVKETTDPLLISPTHLRIVSRTDWLAQPVDKELPKIVQPVPWVVITHTATEGCYNQSQCVLRVRLIQMFHIESKDWDDIGYNFLVAGDGSAYFGRGWDYIGAHTLGYNRYSIGIAFVGTFNTEVPPKKQIEACQKLIKLGVQLGKIAKDYKLFAHRQLASTLSPGDRLYDIIKEWPHFVKDNSNLDELTPKGY